MAEKLSKDLPEDVIDPYAGGDKSIFHNRNYHKDSKDSIKAKVKSRDQPVSASDAAASWLNLHGRSALY